MPGRQFTSIAADAARRICDDPTSSADARTVAIALLELDTTVTSRAMFFNLGSATAIAQDTNAPPSIRRYANKWLKAHSHSDKIAEDTPCRANFHTDEDFYIALDIYAAKAILSSPNSKLNAREAARIVLETAKSKQRARGFLQTETGSQQHITKDDGQPPLTANAKAFLEAMKAAAEAAPVAKPEPHPALGEPVASDCPRHALSACGCADADIGVCPLCLREKPCVAPCQNYKPKSH